MTIDDVGILAKHTIEISSVDVNEVFQEEDEIDITLNGNKITKIVITPKGKLPIEINPQDPIEPCANKPGKKEHKKSTMIWELKNDNSYHIKSITRYGFGGNKYVYTFHWEKGSITSKGGGFFINFFNLILKIFGSGFSGKSGSGGGLQK